MVRIENEHLFDGPQGPVTLTGLFGDSRQLITHRPDFPSSQSTLLPTIHLLRSCPCHKR